MPADIDDYAEFWRAAGSMPRIKPLPAPSRRRLPRLRKHQSAPKLPTWMELQTVIMDAVDEAAGDWWTISSEEADTIVAPVVAVLAAAGIRVRDDRPTGPTLREIFALAGYPDGSCWPGIEKGGIAPW